MILKVLLRTLSPKKT